MAGNKATACDISAGHLLTQIAAGRWQVQWKSCQCQEARRKADEAAACNKGISLQEVAHRHACISLCCSKRSADKRHKDSHLQIALLSQAFAQPRPGTPPLLRSSVDCIKYGIKTTPYDVGRQCSALADCSSLFIDPRLGRKRHGVVDLIK